MFLYISNHTVPAKEQTPSKQPELSSTVETQLLTRKTEFEIHSKVDDFQEISRFFKVFHVNQKPNGIK